MLQNGTFSPGQPDLFRPLVDGLLDGGDPYFVLADFESYIATQERASAEFRNRDAWARKSILNVANMGSFSSDETIKRYATEIWKASMG
jgi:starch phosphorylase